MSKKEAKIQLIPWATIKSALMKDSAFKKGYDDLDLEFTLIRAILEQRDRKGITQKQLAEKIGTKQSAIARFEAGRANPTLSFIKKLSEALDLQLTVRASKS
jgi:ribosome-binding protein aMBF1 (putative translation factor)